MAHFTVRNVPADVVRALRVRAARSGRSAEAEILLILRQVFGSEQETFWAHADAARSLSGRQRSESGALQRKMRHER